MKKGSRNNRNFILSGGNINFPLLQKITTYITYVQNVLTLFIKQVNLWNGSSPLGHTVPCSLVIFIEGEARLQTKTNIIERYIIGEYNVNIFQCITYVC